MPTIDSKKDGRKRAWNVSPKGYKFFDLLSALQKDIRRGNAKEAVYWATELEAMGGNALTALWNRLKVISSEDIGLANQIAPAMIQVLETQYYDLKKAANKNKPERLPLVNAVLFLASSLKSRLVDNLLTVVYGEKDLENYNPPIPEYAFDKHTKAGPKGEAGIEKFCEEGTKLDMEVIADDYKEEAKQILLKREKLNKKEKT